MVKNSFDKAWDFVWHELFCEQTNTFYDYKSSRDADGLYRHLPNSKEILASIENKVGTDDVKVSGYENNKKTDAGNYTAKATELSGEKAKNYIFLL